MAEWVENASLELRDEESNVAVCAVDIHSEKTTQQKKNVLILTSEESERYTEEPVQLLEDCRYFFRVRKLAGAGMVGILADGKTISTNPVQPDTGIIVTHSQAGVLSIDVEAKFQGREILLRCYLGIRPQKFDREEYREMLDDVAERSVNLLLQLSSRSQVVLRPRPMNDGSHIQQQYCFMRWLLDSKSFKTAITEILGNPHRLLRERRTEMASNKSFRANRKSTVEFARRFPRTSVPEGHPIYRTLNSIPRKIVVVSREESADTAENRFVKLCIETYRDFLGELESRLRAQDSPSSKWLIVEARYLRKNLDAVLQEALFKEVGKASFVPFGSPVLQGKRGYREILDSWLKFFGAASLTWEGATDVFGAGKKETDRLYEYWLFFKIVELLESDFGMPPTCKWDLIKVGADGMSLGLKAGRSFDASWLLEEGPGRKLNMRFGYNKTFQRVVPSSREGTWTRTMRPDFTLSWWPLGFSAEEAEDRDAMVHVHFDSKYRVESIGQLFGEDEDDQEEIKKGEKAGNYRRGDLHKMHTYKDAIRRSGGAYILYPGSEKGSVGFKGYHEIIPGVGAFSIRPGTREGIAELSRFLSELIRHLQDKITARERANFHAHTIYADNTRKSKPDCLSRLPEKYCDGSKFPPPNEMSVIVVWTENVKEVSTLYEAGLIPVAIYPKHGNVELASFLSADWAVVIDKAGGLAKGLWKIEGRELEMKTATELDLPGLHKSGPDNVYAVFKVDKKNTLEELYFRKSKLLEIFDGLSMGEISLLPLDFVMQAEGQ